MTLEGLWRDISEAGFTLQASNRGRGMSEGSRLTRRQRRVRRRRKELKESASSVGRVSQKLVLAGALVVSLGGVVASVFANQDALILLFSLSAVILYVMLWIEEAK